MKHILTGLGMRKIKTGMDWLLYKDWDGEHRNRGCDWEFNIYGKIIYLVANNPLNHKQSEREHVRIKQKLLFRCSRQSRYEMIR